CFGKVGAWGGKVSNVHFGVSEHHVSLGGVAIAKDFVHQHLSFFNSFFTNQSSSQKICDGKIVRVLLLLGFQNSNDIFLLPHSQIAVPQQEHSLVVSWVLCVDSGQMSHSLAEATHFVIRQREIQPDRRLSGDLL